MTWMSILTAIIFGFNRWVIFYFGLLNGVYLVLFLVSFAEVMRFVKRTFFSDYEQILKSEMTWPISMIVPAYNEARSIVETVRSLLAVNYGQFEVVVVNDGSSDGTLERLISTFELKRTDRIYHRRLPTGPVRGIYASLDYPNLILVDKEWGGKAEALNTGINVSRYPLFCSVDADSIIEENALLRVVKPFMEHPEEMVAAGGIVRIVNGCEVRDGRVVRIGLPRKSLPVFQVVEYLRAFLGGRIGWSSLRSLLIISGAFGLYRKSEVIAAGGYDGWSETEDLELVLKLHEHMIFNPGHGAIGLLGLPYFLLFETLGPFIEICGYIIVALSFWLGLLNVDFFVLFLIFAVFFGVFLSVASVLLEEVSFRRYPGWEHLGRLVLYGVLENFGYRQVLALFKVKAFWDFLRRRRVWGRMEREGFRAAPTLPAPRT